MSQLSMLAIGLICAGVLLSFISTIWYVVRGFKDSLLWGLVNLLVPGGVLVFTFVKWDRAKAPFLCGLFGMLCVFGVALTTETPFAEQALKEFASGQIKPASQSSAQSPVEELEGVQEKMQILQQTINSETAEVLTLFENLTKRRNNLKTADNNAVQEFNKEAAHYKERNTALASHKQQLVKLNQQQEALFSKQSRTKRTKVIVYSTTWCGACKSAKSYLTAKGVPFEERDVEKSQAFDEEFRTLGGQGVPLIMIGNKKIVGFSPQEIDQALAGK